MMRTRYDFVLYLDVCGGNINGDPDNDGAPRIDSETGKGMITPMCIKRALRDTVEEVFKDYVGYKMLIARNKVLNEEHYRAYEQEGVSIKEQSKENKNKIEPADEESKKKVKQYMCKEYYDVRAFGAVMNTRVSCGNTHGPIQFHQSFSVDPIVTYPQSITRINRTDRDKDNEISDHGQFGKHYITPYGLYKVTGSIIPQRAKETGFGGEIGDNNFEKDLEAFIEGLRFLFMYTASTGRGLITPHRLYFFEHDSLLGNAQPYYLYKTIRAEKQVDVPREFEDYEIVIDEDSIPGGVTLRKIF